MSDYRNYRNMLLVQKHRLDDELEVQADVYERISSATSKAGAALAQAKDDLATVEGKLTLRAKDGADKLTVDAVRAVVLADPERQRAFRALQLAITQHEEWAGLREAWRQKGYALKTLADLYSSNYFQPNSAGRDAQTRDMENRRADIRRAGGREERAADTAIASAREAGVAPRREGTPTVERMRASMADAEPARRERRRAE